MKRNDSIHNPGVVSAFFIYKAGLFAACFWTWVAVLAIRGVPVTGWHLVATAGAVSTTVIGVVLGVRHASQRAAARRHEEIMRTLVDISWNAFAAVPPTSFGRDTLGRDSIARDPAGGDEPASRPDDASGQAEVIQLAQDVRPRFRR